MGEKGRPSARRELRIAEITGSGYRKRGDCCLLKLLDEEKLSVRRDLTTARSLSCNLAGRQTLQALGSRRALAFSTAARRFASPVAAPRLRFRFASSSSSSSAAAELQAHLAEAAMTPPKTGPEVRLQHRTSRVPLPGMKNLDGTREPIADGTLDSEAVERIRGLPLAVVGALVLNTADPETKCKLTHAAWHLWQAGEVPGVGTAEPPEHPARPEEPRLVHPHEVPLPKALGVSNIVWSLHGLAHVELNAIDLAWDIAVRFAPLGLPEEFYKDFLEVADDEARHFSWLAERLQILDSRYGALPAHDFLWDCAVATKHDLAARLAVVPLVQEARGLDAGPRFVERMNSAADFVSMEVVRQIMFEEEEHVTAGMRWFLYECDRRGLDPLQHFQACIRDYSPPLRPPFNRPARARCGMEPEWYEPVAKYKLHPTTREEMRPALEPEEAAELRRVASEREAELRAFVQSVAARAGAPPGIELP
eukprot:tig00021348_g20508.t1